MEASSFHGGRVRLYRGDCREALRELPDCSVDSVVTDPPYNLKFMGKRWDTGETSFDPEFWRDVLRVLKPGGHMLAFGGTRTFHRLACAIEDGGFEIRDAVMWHYGSGMPKSHDVSKAIDKAAGAEREIVGESPFAARKPNGSAGVNSVGLSATPCAWLTAPSTAAAREWQGWGTAFKPATEIISLARKPLSENTIAANVLRWGVGALNIDGCRVATDWKSERGETWLRSGNNAKDVPDYMARHGEKSGSVGDRVSHLGRWPANVLHDGSDEVVGAFPDAPGQQRSVGPANGAKVSVNTYGDYGPSEQFEPRQDSGSAARFFYQVEPDHAIGAYINSADHGANGRSEPSRLWYSSKADSDDRLGSKHPTVKPLDLKQYLIRLITPKRVLFCSNCDTLRNAKNSPETASPDTPVRMVSDGVQTEGQSTHGAVLQQTVRGSCERLAAEAVRLVRNDVPTKEGRGETLLQPVVRSEMDGQVPEDIARLCDEQSGLQTTLDAGSPAVAQSEGLHLRAPLGNATEGRQAAFENRSGTSQKRDQKRQSARELGSDVEGRSRQTKSAETERPVLPALSGDDHHKQTCSHCGHRLEYRPGVCLDPFAGTGTTGEAALREGMNCILIEREPEYQADIERRMKHVFDGELGRSVAIAKARPQKGSPLSLFPEAAE